MCKSAGLGTSDSSKLQKSYIIVITTVKLWIEVQNHLTHGLYPGHGTQLLSNHFISMSLILQLVH